MTFGYTVIDDFYDNPEFVREYALKQEYNVTGNYPGVRCSHSDELEEGCHNLGTKLFFETYLERNITWSNEYNGTLQYVVDGEVTWIHKDNNVNVEYASLIFLYPDPPDGDYGTSFFKHIPTNTYGSTQDEDLDNEIMSDGQNREK